jgi:hypothetical protein
VIKDDSIIRYSVQTSTDICKKSIGEYKFIDADRFTGESSFSLVSHEGDINKYLNGSSVEKTIQLKLYNQADAQTMTERHNFYKSLTQSLIRIEGKLNISTLSINQPVLIDVSNIYDRFGVDGNTKRIGIISKISRNYTGGSIEVTDLGNIFNRSCKITSNTASDYTLASDEDKVKNGYIVDDNTDTPDELEPSWGTNLIS